MHILVLQHAVVEHPGVFRRFLAEDGHSWDAVNLNLGEPLPEISGYDAVALVENCCSTAKCIFIARK